MTRRSSQRTRLRDLRAMTLPLSSLLTTRVQEARVVAFA